MTVTDEDDQADYDRGMQAAFGHAARQSSSWLRHQLTYPQPGHWTKAYTAGFDAALKLLIAAKESEGG